MPFSEYFYKVLGLEPPEYKRMMADVHSVTIGAMYAIGCAIRTAAAPSNSTFNGSTITSAQPP
jgi:hypothetical protein